jgi:hypothetical protein
LGATKNIPVGITKRPLQEVNKPRDISYLGSEQHEQREQREQEEQTTLIAMLTKITFVRQKLAHADPRRLPVIEPARFDFCGKKLKI